MPERSRPQGGPRDADRDDLLVRYRNGDVAAFDAIVHTYQDRLIQFFYRQCWDRSRAEDLAQTLFLKLIRTAARYRPEGKLDTYLFRVATNLWIDQYRSRAGLRRLHSLDQALAHGVDPETTVDRQTPELAVEADEERELLRGALGRLSEPHRLVFELAVYQELPYAEIAAILDIPVGTVKSRMHNSVRALREILGAADRARDDGHGPSRPFPGRAGADPGLVSGTRGFSSEANVG